LTPTQCRAARKLLKWRQRDLAWLAAVSVPTVWNFEKGKCTPKPENLAAMWTAFEWSGVEFTVEAGGSGVRLRKP
jgi:predicted transcriptional regulator